jgi:PBP1b-binding outer membrane lipoprotein LpoB
MRKTILILLLVLMAAVFVTGCSKQKVNYQAQSYGQHTIVQQQNVEPATDTNQYIDSQFIDPNETIEIGEMI